MNGNLPQTPTTHMFPTAGTAPPTPAGGHPAIPLSAQPPVLPPGSMMLGRWRVVGKLGQGAFGQTLEAEDGALNQRRIAIKFETGTAAKQVLKLEISILKRLYNCPFTAKLIASGTIDIGDPPAPQTYMVMELLGTNLSDLRKQMPGSKFSAATTAILGRQMMEGLEWVHQVGYLHRDVKPSNFVMSLDRHPDRNGVPRARCYIIDFGLSRRFLTPEGGVRDPRPTAGFRGTARYASLNAHESKELARRDDFWSILYLLVEFLTGQLPWRKEKDRDAVYRLKRACTTEDLVWKLGDPMVQLYRHILSLEYAAVPNYALMCSYMDNLQMASGEPAHVEYDWERRTPVATSPPPPPPPPPIHTAGAAGGAKRPAVVLSAPPPGRHRREYMDRLDAQQQPEGAVAVAASPTPQYRPLLGTTDAMPSPASPHAMSMPTTRPRSPHPDQLRRAGRRHDGNGNGDDDELDLEDELDDELEDEGDDDDDLDHPHDPAARHAYLRGRLSPSPMAHPTSGGRRQVFGSFPRTGSLPPPPRAPASPAAISGMMARLRVHGGGGGGRDVSSSSGSLRRGTGTPTTGYPVADTGSPTTAGGPLSPMSPLPPPSSMHSGSGGKSDSTGGGSGKSGNMFQRLQRGVRGLRDQLLQKSPTKNGLAVHGRSATPAPLPTASSIGPPPSPYVPHPAHPERSQLEAMHKTYDSKYGMGSGMPPTASRAGSGEFHDAADGGEELQQQQQHQQMRDGSLARSLGLTVGGGGRRPNARSP
ncbi:kinase-like domain-containing protein [Blastocladiella britannica]|nr:kinase-like domain-containing protein [Blastocladiella britannica]